MIKGSDWPDRKVADITLLVGQVTSDPENHHRARLAILDSCLPCPVAGSATELRWRYVWLLGSFGDGVQLFLSFLE